MYILHLVGGVIGICNEKATVLLTGVCSYDPPLWLSRRDSHEGRFDWVIIMRPEAKEVRRCTFTVTGAGGGAVVEAEVLLARGGSKARWRAVELTLGKFPGGKSPTTFTIGKSVDETDPRILALEEGLSAWR
jgi:hypothetical protein